MEAASSLLEFTVLGRSCTLMRHAMNIEHQQTIILKQIVSQNH